MDTEFRDNFVRQIVELWINPEIKRRRDEGRLPDNFGLFAAQVIMNFDSPTQVRLNEEVKALIKGRFNKPGNEGQQVNLDEMESIENVELTSLDPNAGHITILAHRGGWFIKFDFLYNVARSRMHLEVAREFLDAATSSLERKHFRAFVDNLFSAVELLAKAALLSHDREILTSKAHGVVHSKFNLWGKLGNTDLRYTSLLNRLSSLRSSSRYLKSAFNLSPEEALNMITVAEEMFENINQFPIETNSSAHNAT